MYSGMSLGRQIDLKRRTEKHLFEKRDAEERIFGKWQKVEEEN